MAEQSLYGQARRSLGAAGAAVLLLLGLSACEVIPAPRPVAAEEPVAEPEQAPPPVEDEDRPGPLPAESRGRVAILVPLTGANAGVGQSIANAANLAILDTGGERIRLTVYDTAKGGAAVAANQALADGNRLILGPLLAEEVRAVAPVARRADVPVVAFSNDVSVAGGGVYLMGFAPSQSVQRVVGFAAERGLQRFGGLAPEGVYGRRAGEALVGAVARARGSLVGTQYFGPGPGAVRTAVSRLGGGLDAVLIADSGRGAAAAAPVVKAALPGARLLGTELWAAEADLGRTAALRGAWYAAVSDNMFAQLRPRYRARYGANPYRLASLGYDAVLLAVRVAKDWLPGRPFPARGLRDRDGFSGIDGAFRFSDEGIAERSLEVREVTATGTMVVSPAPRGFEG